MKRESYKESIMFGNIKEREEATKRESKENEELFRGTVGFDFIFDKSGKAYCVEINGDKSGIEGMSKLRDSDKLNATQRIMAGIRSGRDEEVIKDVKAYNKMLHNSPRYKDGSIILKSDQLKLRLAREKMEQKPIFQHAYKNPKILDEIFDDKSRQVSFIPEEYAPRHYSQSEIRNLQDNKLYIVKGIDSSLGEDVHIFYGRDIKNNKRLTDNAVIQEFINPTDADNGPDGHPASLRLLIDFRVIRVTEGDEIKDKIEPIYITGYQRVSTHGKKEIENGDNHGKHATLRDVYVVNKSRGALSYTMSEREFKTVMPIALEILENLKEHVILHSSQEEDVAMAV